jgi:hypothetical protein
MNYPVVRELKSTSHVVRLIHESNIIYPFVREFNSNGKLVMFFYLKRELPLIMSSDLLKYNNLPLSSYNPQN